MGRAYVVTVVIAGLLTLIWRFPQALPNPMLFAGLLLASSLASSHRVRLPLVSSSSTLSVSYAIDFASLFLVGTDLTMLVGATSALVQSTLGTPRGQISRNPPGRVFFNVGALVLTIQASGAAITFFGPTESMRLAVLAGPMVSGALAYYLVNTALVATAIAFSSGQSAWRVWESNFLWTGPSYFVGAGAAVAAVVTWNADRGWMLPLIGAPVYLTFRSYSIYIDRLAADQRHSDEVMRLHHDAVTALEAAKRSEQRYALAAAGSNDGLWDWDIPQDALYCSDRWKLMLGLPAHATVTAFDHWLALVHPDEQAGLRAALDAHLNGDTSHFEHEYRACHADGHTRWVLCRGIAVRDEAGEPIRMAGSQTDVTEWRRAQDTLATAARHDHLTDLPNRRLFSELLQRSMAQNARVAEPRYAVLFIDLDGFKLVNDSLGHLVGDQFLVAIATRLKAHLRPGDALARLGGDEFAVLIDDFSSPDEVCLVADRLQDALVEPIKLDDRELYASASMGIVLGGAQYRTVDDLLRDADIAMYRAKAAGRGGYQLFDPLMHASAVHRLTLETELRQGIERGEFEVYYQPIVSLPSSEITGIEALARWSRPDKRQVRPAEFIPVAEETGLIVPLTRFMLQEACRQGAIWQKAFARPLGVSVNISSRLFARADFVAHVEDAVREAGLAAGTLHLEVTENVLLNTSDVVQANFERLRQIGVSMYLDDFGTGYSSLSYLQRYPVDALKLDSSFVARMGTPDEGSAIADAIVKLARALGMDLIAEGVESAAHAEHLIALGCPHAQGHLYASPRSAAETQALLVESFLPGSEKARRTTASAA